MIEEKVHRLPCGISLAASKFSNADEALCFPSKDDQKNVWRYLCFSSKLYMSFYTVSFPVYCYVLYKYSVVSLIHVVRVLALTYSPKKLIVGS